MGNGDGFSLEDALLISDEALRWVSTLSGKPIAQTPSTVTIDPVRGVTASVDTTTILIGVLALALLIYLLSS